MSLYECWIGPNVVMTNAKYPNSTSAKKELKGVVIRQGAIIGENCTVLPGITIGENALIGASAVVTKDVCAKGVVIGNPANLLKLVDQLPAKFGFN